MFKLHLKEIRKARGMSQQELADAIGVTKFVLGTWEREDTKLPLDKACDIARALNCTLDQLAGRDEMSMMYDFVDGRCSAWSAEKMYYALKNCIDFIFEGNFENANVSFRNFVNA